MTFKKEKVSALSGNTEVRFTHLLEGELLPFTLVASKEGLRFQGKSTVLENQEQLQEFAKVVSDAWTEHKKLLKGAMGTLAD